MRHLIKGFLDENQLNKKLYIAGIINRDPGALGVLNKRFNDYVFRLYLCSYIKKSICNASRDIKKKQNIQGKREKLCLNVIEVDFEEERVNTIPDLQVDFLDEIFSNGGINNCSEMVISDRRLSAALSSLTERQREIIFKCILQEKEEGEVAEELMITRQAVNKTKNVALEKLKKRLEVI